MEPLTTPEVANSFITEVISLIDQVAGIMRGQNGEDLSYDEWGTIYEGEKGLVQVWHVTNDLRYDRNYPPLVAIFISKGNLSLLLDIDYSAEPKVEIGLYENYTKGLWEDGRKGYLDEGSLRNQVENLRNVVSEAFKDYRPY